MSDDNLVTIEGVELLSEGEWISGLTGKKVITSADIDEIIEASKDSEIDMAALRVGHVDPRFDGEPALAWLANLRRNGGKLVADLERAPKSLETMIRSAYRRRSAEIGHGVKTPSGKTYGHVLTGLALLGVQTPAVKGLADVASRYSSPSITAETTSRVTTIDGDGQLSLLVDEMTNAITNLSGPSGHNDGHATISRGDSVKDEEVRKALGLADDFPVTDALRQIAKNGVKMEADAKAKADADAKAADEKAKVDAEAKAKADADAAAQAAAEGPTTVIDRAVLADLQAKALLGEQAHQMLANQERDRELQTALSGGKISPATVDAYRKLWDVNPQQTKDLLSALPVAFSTTSQFSGTQSGANGKTGTNIDENGLSDEDYKDFMGDITKFMRTGDNK